MADGILSRPPAQHHTLLPQAGPSSSMRLRLRSTTLSHFRKIKVFNQDLGKLGEEVIRQNETCFYNKIREEFKNWVLTLTANTPNGKS